jgi:hypothetical protein
VYTVPCLWLFSIYTPCLPVVGQYLPTVGGVLALAYAYFNFKYVPAYMNSAAERIPHFKRRTLVFRALIFGAVGGIACSVAQMAGLLK